MSNASCDIGLIRLAVMGQNLVLNMNNHGYKVAVFNRTVSKVDDFLKNEAAAHRWWARIRWPSLSSCSSHLGASC